MEEIMKVSINIKHSVRMKESRKVPYAFVKCQKGALLIALIITMVILSALCGGLVYIFSSSNLNPISGNYAQQAYYNAEAGFHYVTALYRVAGDKTVFNAYTTPQTITLPGGGTAKVTVAGLVANYTSVKTTATVSGSNLLLSAVTFPSAPGSFTKDGDQPTKIYRYTGKSTDGSGNITLTGIYPVITAGGTINITTIEQATITSVGSYGSGLWHVSRTKTYLWPLGGTGSGSGGDGEPLSPPDPTDFPGGQQPIYTPETISSNDYSTPNNRSGVTTAWYSHPQGGTYERTDLIVYGYYSLGNNTNPIRYLYVPFKHNTAGLGLYQAWDLNNEMLSYDVQVKMGTTPPVSYASMGFMFRARLQGSGQNTYYTGYGISLIRYENLTQSDDDYIPNSVKPALAGGGTQNNQVLLVLWEQTGQTTWRWLAYKKLHLLTPGSGWGGDNWNQRTTSEIYDNWVRGSQYSGDGYFIHDDTTLMIRVVEKMVDGARTNDIQLFFGDARWSSNNQNGRTQDANAYNVMANRFGYHRRFSPSAAEQLWKWPSLPNIASSNWNATQNDWFTAVTWDRVNTASGVTASLMADEAGIYSIVRDNAHTSAGFTNNQTNFPELVIHTFGDLDNNRTIHFTDFGVRLLQGGGGGAGLPWVGPIIQ